MTDQPPPPSPTPPTPGPSSGPRPPAPPAPSGGGRAPGGRASALRRQLVAWIALALFCLATVSSQGIVRLFMGSPSPEGLEASEVSSFQVEVVGRFSLGAEAVLGSAMGGSELQSAQLRDLAEPLDEIAEMDDARQRHLAYIDRLRVIILLGELAGAEEGLEQIDALLGAPDVPEGLLQDARLMRRIYEHGPESLGADEQDRLIDRHGWTGRLATTFGRTPDDPMRASVLDDARLTFFGLIGLLALGVLALPVGLALLIVGVILLANGTIRPRYRPDRSATAPQHAAFLELVALFMGGLALTNLAGAFLDRLSADQLSQALEFWVSMAGLLLYGVQWALLLLVFWPMVRGVDLSRLVNGLGWVPGRGVAREIGAGLIGYIAGLPVVGVGFVLMYLLMWLTEITPSHPIVEGAGDQDLFSILFIYSVAVVWAPLVEETIFRGAFYHHLRRWIGPLVSALIVALVFAGIHPQGFVAMPPLMALALVFAAIREWRGSLFGAMAAHALHNGILMTVNIFFLAS